MLSDEERFRLGCLQENLSKIILSSFLHARILIESTHISGLLAPNEMLAGTRSLKLFKIWKNTS